MKERRDDLKGSKKELSNPKEISLKLWKFRLLKQHKLYHKKWRVLEP